jgi:outer membrane protein TolC
MTAICRSSKRGFYFAVVVTLALAIASSAMGTVASRGRQEPLPDELSLADSIAIYLERAAPPAGIKDIASDEARRRGIQRVKEAFHGAVFAQYLIGEADSERQYFDELLEIAQARADVGAAPESDAAKVRHERARAEESIAEARLQLRQALIRLVGMLRVKDFRNLPEVTGNLNIMPVNIAFDKLNEMALQRRPSENTPRERILAEVESAYASLATHRERAAAIQSTSLPLASDLHRIAHNLYFEKKDGLLNLFEARRSRREVRQKYFRALLDYHLSLALLESAVGKDFYGAGLGR